MTDKSKKNKISVVKFYIDGCPYCLSRAAHFESLRNRFPNIEFSEILSNDRSIAHRRGVKLFPTFVVTHDGREEHFVGSEKFGGLVEYIKKLN